MGGNKNERDIKSGIGKVAANAESTLFTAVLYDSSTLQSRGSHLDHCIGIQWNNHQDNLPVSNSFLILHCYTTLCQINYLKGKSIFLCLLPAMWFMCLSKLGLWQPFRAELSGVGGASL